MFDFSQDGWTYGPLIVIAILYFLWRFLKPGTVKRDRRGRDFKTRFRERQRDKDSGVGSENLKDRETYRERWDEKRKY
ncbi:hypothetical protein BH23BAC2_BH23BAC2_03890 [soil metagenome]